MGNAERRAENEMAWNKMRKNKVKMENRYEQSTSKHKWQNTIHHFRGRVDVGCRYLSVTDASERRVGVCVCMRARDECVVRHEPRASTKL